VLGQMGHLCRWGKAEWVSFSSPAVSTSSAARLRRRPRSFSITRLAFSRAAARSSLAWIALSMAAISCTLIEGTWLKMLRYQCTMHLCQAASRKNSAALSASPMQASEWDLRQSDHRHPHPDNFVFLGLSSFFCDAPRPHLLA